MWRYNLVYLVSLYVILLTRNFPVNSEETIDSEIILVHVLFRHGNRTPEAYEVYKRDPYVNEEYHPIQKGSLTNVGKQRLWRMGKALRERYDTLLGDYYVPSEVEAQSTNFERTKASLLLVSAGLFPPKKYQIWNEDLLWQPIPYSYRLNDNDEILNGISCSNHKKLYDEYMQSPNARAEFKRYSKIAEYISKYTGEEINSFRNVYNLYFGLSTESEFGLKLPKWTKAVWPDVITHMAINHYYDLTATTEMKRFAAGFFIQKIINDTRNKITGESRDKKMYLYSAHENNIAQVLILLNVFTSHVPPYTSYLAIEVHNLGENKYGLKIIYENYTSDKPSVLRIPNCELICPLDTFEALVKEYLPTTERCKG